MDPRTFLPASRLRVAAPPEIGAPAPELPAEVADVADERAVVLAFLRHAGCPFAEATLRRLRDAAEGASDVTFVAVSHARPEASEKWCHAVGGSGRVHLVTDPDRHLYAAWGLGQTSLGHFLGRRSLQAVAGLAREGIRNRHPSGTRWQSAGTFALDASHTVCWRHLPAHAGELPDVSAALRALG